MTKDKSYVQEDYCPKCGHAVDCATHPTEDNIRPRVGDLSFCIYCTSVLAFGDGLKLRLATPEEAKEVEDQITKIREALTQIKGFAS